jgi:hypothetical protein
MGKSCEISLRDYRVVVAIILTAICIFLVMWQHESTDMVLNAEIYEKSEFGRMERYFVKESRINQRDLAYLGPEEADWRVRHKLRWAYKTLEVSVYKFIARQGSVKLLRYSVLSHYVGIFTLAFIFCLLVLQHELGRLKIAHILISSAAFVGFVSAIFHVTHWQEDFTPIEMAAISIAIAGAQRKNKWLFFAALILAVSNRESGLAVALIYPLINPERLVHWLIPSGVAIGLFAALNFDLLIQPELYRIGNFIVTGTNESITFLNFYKFSASKWATALLSYLSFVAPMLLLAGEGFKSTLGRRYWSIFGLYIFIILFGSFLTNSFLFLMLLPIYYLIVGSALGRQKSKP